MKHHPVPSSPTFLNNLKQGEKKTNCQNAGKVLKNSKPKNPQKAAGLLMTFHQLNINMYIAYYLFQRCFFSKKIKHQHTMYLVKWNYIYHYLSPRPLILNILPKNLKFGNKMEKSCEYPPMLNTRESDWHHCLWHYTAHQHILV